MIGDQLAAWLTEYLAHLRLRLGCLLVTHQAAVLDVKLPLSKPTTAWLDNWLAINSPVFCLPKLNAFGAGYKTAVLALEVYAPSKYLAFPLCSGRSAALAPMFNPQPIKLVPP